METEEEATGDAKQARTGPPFTDKQEMSIIDFVKEHPKLCTKENAPYVDKAQKDAPWNHTGEEFNRTGPDIHRWFNSQRTWYGMGS